VAPLADGVHAHTDAKSDPESVNLDEAPSSAFY